MPTGADIELSLMLTMLLHEELSRGILVQKLTGELRVERQVSIVRDHLLSFINKEGLRLALTRVSAAVHNVERVVQIFILSWC